MLKMSNKKLLIDRVNSIVTSRFNGNWNEFGRFIGLSQSTLQNIKAGGAVNVNTAIRISGKLGLSLEWLLANIGPMYREERGRKLVIDASVPLEAFPKEQILVWIEVIWPDLTPQQRAWFHEQFRRAFPEFGAWLDAYVPSAPQPDTTAQANTP